MPHQQLSHEPQAFSRVRFSVQDIEDFAACSQDSNPLHTDPGYARSTPFGQVVVFGVCAALRVLAQWANCRSFRLKKIHCQFRKPIFLDKDYDLEYSDQEGIVAANLCLGGVPQLSLKFHWEPASSVATISSQTRQLRLNYAEGSYDYSIAGGEETIRRATGLHTSQIPTSQLNALLWASYHVGMVKPGRQALFAEFAFEFAAGHENPTIHLVKVETAFDSRFNRHEIRGEGTGIRSFLLRAFARPAPVTFPLADLMQCTIQARANTDKVILVTGGSRGFGAILCRLLALSGAKVILNYCSSSAEAEAIRAEATQLSSGTIYLAQADLSSESDCQRMVHEIQGVFGKIDMLICNATHPIPPVLFREQSAQEILYYVGASIGLTLNVLKPALGIMGEKGCVVSISSEVVKVAAPGFAHYAAGKAAVEALLRIVAVEQRISVLVARPPRMRTDLVNGAFNMQEPASPVDIAADLLRVLMDLPGDCGYREIDLSTAIRP